MAKLQQAVIKWWENEKRVTRRSVRSHISKYLWSPSLVRSGEGSFKCTHIDHPMRYVCDMHDADNISMDASKSILKQKVVIETEDTEIQNKIRDSLDKSVGEIMFSSRKKQF